MTWKGGMGGTVEEGAGRPQAIFLMIQARGHHRGQCRHVEKRQHITE